MKNSLDIHSYDDLMNEKQRLKTLFSDQKQAIRNDVTLLKDSLDPIKKVGKSLGNLFTPDKSLGLLNDGLGFGLDFLLRKAVLKKSGWITRIVAPFFIKNALSHFAADKIKTQMPDVKDAIKTVQPK